METTEQPNSGNPVKGRTVVKVLYAIAMTALVGLLLISLFFYGREWQRMHPNPTGVTEPITSSTPYTEESDPSESAQPSGVTEPSGTLPTDPIQDTEPEQTEPVKPTEPGQTESVKPTNPAVSKPTAPAYPADSVVIELPAHTKAVCLIGKAAQDYLNAKNVTSVSDFLAPYFNGKRLDVGVPVELSYVIRHLPKGVSVRDAIFQISTSDDFKQVIEYEAEPGAQFVRVYNLLAGVKYHYRVIITLSDGSSQTLKSSFQTAATPRLMNIDGIVNVRDIGGWKTADGKTVKQGLLYRGSELDGSVESGFKLTEKGKEQMRHLLGIRTDLDLRHDGEDSLGPDVEHIYYNAIQYEHAFTPVGKDAVRRLFADLADPGNYPAYLHCTYGADRTGTMCYLLLGLLGVDDADLMRDYELTALYYGYVSPELMDAFVQRIAELPGDTTQERVEHFLLSSGVTEQEIESIRQIFLG